MQLGDDLAEHADCQELWVQSTFLPMVMSIKHSFVRFWFISWFCLGCFDNKKSSFAEDSVDKTSARGGKVYDKGG